MRVLLLEIDVVSPEGEASTLRFSDRAMSPLPPGDADRPNLVWSDRLVQPPTLRRALFEDLATLSPAIGVGSLSLVNADRMLDAYQSHAWGEMRLWRYETGAPFSEAEPIITGRCGSPGFGLAARRPGRVEVPLMDYRIEVEGPLQTVFYAGTNNGTSVLYEGEPDGLKGSPKPLAYGDLRAAHLPLPMVNGAVLAHQFHAGVVQGSELVFDRGDSAGLADAGDASGAAFDAATPAAAQYKTDVGRGLIKLNTSPVGRLTFGVKGDAAGGYVETAGPILARLLAKAGVPGARIDASIAALSSAAVVGAYFGDATSARDAIGWVARSARAAVLPDRLGVWRAFTFGQATLVVDHVIGYDEVIDIEAGLAPEPAGEVHVGWGRQWSTFKGSELAPALRNTAAAEKLAAEYRYAIVVDAAAKTRFPTTWRTLKITTALRAEADAIALAGELKSLFGLRLDGKPRRMWRVTLDLTPERLALDLGATIELHYEPAGINDLFLLVGEEPLRPSRDQVIWTLWG